MSTSNNFDVAYDKGSICGSIGGDTFVSPRKTGNNNNSYRSSSYSISRRSNKLPLQVNNSLSKSYEAEDEQYQQKFEDRFNSRFHSFRFLVVMFSGFSVGLMFLLRYNVTVAILNMVNQTKIYLTEHPNKTIEDFENEGYSSTGEFDWDNEIQHMIMSWYMIAYTLPQMPCTKLGIMVGSKYSIPISLFLCASTTILTPIFSYNGWQWLIALRLVNGIGASAVMPMMLDLIENWMPYNEITLGLTCAQLITSTITALNPLLAGYLCSIHWKYAFYVPGIATIIFCILWLILITDHPYQNRFVSEKELDLIYACDSNNNINNNNNNTGEKVLQKINNEEGLMPAEVAPTWLDLFKVPSFYAYLTMWSFYCSPYSIFSFILPTYLRQFLKIRVAENGFYCFIIQSGAIISVLWPHPFLRFLQQKLGFSLTVSRRITYFIVCFMVGSTWIYVGTFHTTQLILLVINRAFHNSTDIVVTGNLMGNFAKAGLSSIAFSMVNTIGNLSIVGFSTFCGYVLDVTGQSVQGWTYIWYGLAASQLIVFFIFSIFIDANPISFNLSKKNSKEVEEHNKTIQDKKSLSNIFIILPNNGDKNSLQLINNLVKHESVENNEKCSL